MVPAETATAMVVIAVFVLVVVAALHRCVCFLKEIYTHQTLEIYYCYHIVRAYMQVMHAQPLNASTF